MKAIVLFYTMWPSVHSSARPVSSLYVETEENLLFLDKENGENENEHQ